MSLKDYLKKNGLKGLSDVCGKPLILKLTPDMNITYDWALIKDTDVEGKFELEFGSFDPVPDGSFVVQAGPDGSELVHDDYAFISFNTVYDSNTSKYTYTNKTINFVGTNEATPVEVTDVLLIADAQAQGIDVSGATGPTIEVTRERSDWEVVSCVKRVEPGVQVVYDGSKEVVVDFSELV